MTVPFLTKIATLLVRGGVEELKKNDAALARWFVTIKLWNVVD